MKSGELNYKDTLQTIVADVITSYYDIVSSVQQLQGLKKAEDVSVEREKITEKQFQVGTSSEVDLLQAKVDLNEEKERDIGARGFNYPEENII